MNKKKLGIIIAANAVILFALYSIFTGDQGKKRLTVLEKAEASVTITNLEKNSGGTGTILRSSSTLSAILTNKHVCRLLEKNGGLVTTRHNKEYLVRAVREASNHDLCLVYVTADLHQSTAVATTPPEVPSRSQIVGHPRLYPVSVTDGYFSDHLLVTVRMGVIPCAPYENTLDCIFLGGHPVEERFEAQLTTALIMPGSSGSAVYNEQGEIAGVAFAGSGDLGFSLIVPLEYVNEFLISQQSDQLMGINYVNTRSD